MIISFMLFRLLYVPVALPTNSNETPCTSVFLNMPGNETGTSAETTSRFDKCSNYFWSIDLDFYWRIKLYYANALKVIIKLLYYDFERKCILAETFHSM